MNRSLRKHLSSMTLATTGLAVAAALSAAPLLPTAANAEESYTLEDYNRSLVKFGVPFYAHYPASFYTGFAPRVEDPNRVHFRAGRGNVVRLTAVLDEYTVMTYPYSLTKRYDAYAKAQAAGMFQTTSTGQLDAFRRIVDSPAYDVRGTIAAFDAGKLDRPELYEKSLRIMTQLNPGRIRTIEIDLRKQLLAWRDRVRAFAKSYEGEPTDIEAVKKHIEKNPDDSIVLTDAMIPGRVNAIFLTGEQIGQLASVIESAAGDDDAEFLGRALTFFGSATDARYDFKTVARGKLVEAIRCEAPAKSCKLVYPELTAIYPNGSTVASAHDRQGNEIHKIRNNGLMTFIDRGYHDVDHIRTEGYYGYAPKMDWQDIGNGIHNPGVSHWLAGMKHVYAELDIPEEYKFVWVVSRGPVSHGCIRMSTGHLWETRHVFPSSPQRMKELHYRGNASEDYDVFDLEADGTPEVIGVDYEIVYSVKGSSGDNRRKGKGFSTTSIPKDEFYENLYGAKGQYVRKGDGYEFPSPHVTHFRKNLVDNATGKPISRRLDGTYVLYEQPYERDKVQIYRLPAKYQSQLAMKDDFASTGKQMVRVLGRVSGCGPFKSEYEHCYEDSFDVEFEKLLGNL